MAGWSKLKDGLDHDNHNLSCFHVDFGLEDGVIEQCKETVERLFDELIPIYLREVSVDKIARPLPALLGDGEEVNLFRLFWAVKKKGGFNSISENGLWGSVAEECFLSAKASVKLVYTKYLKEFDGWLRQVYKDKRPEYHLVEIEKKLDLLKVKGEELKGLVWSDEDKKGDDGELGLEFDDRSGSSAEIYNGKHRSQVSDGSVFNKVHHNKENIYDETGSCIDLGTCTSGLLLSNGGGDLNEVNHIVESSNDSEKDICIQGNESIMSSAKCVGDNVISSIKSEFCSLPEVDNVQENVANTYDDDEKFHDDDDLLLSARRIADKLSSFQNEGKNLWPREGINKVRKNAERIKNDCRKVHVQDDASVELSSTTVSNEVGVSRKRKWESTFLPGMLNWITQVAKRPHDPATGIIPGPSNWTDHESDEYWTQALLAREALLIKRPIYANFEESSLQKKPKMHPSMYEDINALHQSAERVRCSQRIPLPKSQSCACCNLASQSKVAGPRKAQARDHKLISSVEVPSSPALDASHKETPFERLVAVGLAYQAEVPEWTGVVSESDSKWLGKRVWDPEDENKGTLIVEHPIGKGRQSSCDCSLPGSSACVKWHITEERFKLKQALGGHFYRWKFNRMGEEVSLSWTPEEKEKFKKMVLEKTTVNKFLKNAFRVFPFKTREKLVSYYFNVFVLQRRRYQNRVTPKNIDSDDDETKLGSVGDSAYMEGNYVVESNLSDCSLSVQYSDSE